MNQETIDYYNKASSEYSNIRYKGITNSFSQYLFKKRLELFLSLLKGIEKNLPKNAIILEIGCADGVVLRAIDNKFPGRFSKLIGMDISPKMLEEANKQNTNDRTSFYLKDNLPPENFDVMVELGVHPFGLDTELAFACGHLKTNGYFFYDLVSARSIFVRLKLKNMYYIKDYKTYTAYELFIVKYFSIVKTHTYGLFVPKLWKFPVLGRIFQPFFDLVFKKITPELFHEKIYCLKKLD